MDDRSDGHALGLYDALGLGRRTLHYEVGVAYHHARRRRLAGIGDFRDLRRLSLAEVMP